MLKKHFTAAVTVPREGESFKVDIFVHFGKGVFVQIHTLPEDTYTTFNTAAINIAKRLRWFKWRLRNHHRGRDEKLSSIEV